MPLSVREGEVCAMSDPSWRRHQRGDPFAKRGQDQLYSEAWGFAEGILARVCLTADPFADKPGERAPGEDPRESPKGEDPRESPKGEDPRESPKGEDPRESPKGDKRSLRS